MSEWWGCGRCFVIEVVGVPGVAIVDEVFPTTRNPSLLWLTALVLLCSHVVGWHIDRDRETCSSNGCKHAALIPASRKVKHVFSTVRCVNFMHVGSHEWVMGNMLEQQFQRQCMILCIIRSGSGDQFQDGGTRFLQHHPLTRRMHTCRRWRS